MRSSYKTKNIDFLLFHRGAGFAIFTMPALEPYGSVKETVHNSSDHLDPKFDSSNRKSQMVVAIFNLSATIVGGGVLSLPLAFMKCGILLGSILMILAALVTERSLYLLCLCARRTGATTYGEVGKAAFGKHMEYFISLLLFFFLALVLVGYMVLLQDIWSDIVEIVLRLDAPPSAPLVLLCILVLMAPFLVERTLHSLRFNCYVGFASVSVLCLALCHHAITVPLPTNLRMWGDDLDDILFAFPIIILSFLSIFNVLQIQGNLIKPSRGRMLGVIDGAVGSCFVLMFLFGLSGYIYAGEETDGNILNNADIHADWVFFLGRLGCGVTIMLAMAMMLLPARAGLLEVVDVFVNGPHIVSAEIVSEETPLVMQDTSKDSPSASGTVMQSSLMENDLMLYATTFGIVTICYFVAIRVPGVAFVWSLCGSAMAFLIAFFLPAACYLQIQREYPKDEDNSKWWAWFSWFLVISSLMSSVVCTIQTVRRYA